MGSEMINALFLTKYSREGASSRYRFLQYFPYLESNGIRCDLSPLTDAKYLEHLYSEGRGRFSDAASSFLRRIKAAASIPSYDVVIVEYEILPYFPALIEKLLASSGIPFIVNYDDAIFYRYGMNPNALVRLLLGRKIAAVMRSSSLVIAGNDFLAAYARASGAARVEVMPTVVDISKYPGRPRGDGSVFTIGWIGSPSTRKYLNAVAPALAGVCAGSRARLVLIGSGPVEMPGVPVEVRAWSEATEVADLESCDAGIMPLYDGLWEQGKCGLKLVQYMACGLPVVVSPVGMNIKLVHPGVSGFYAEDEAGWSEALSALRDDKALRAKLGSAGRRIAEEKYSLQVTAPRFAELIRQVAASRKKS
jgi:glycosyltransferase involved in cell wall biosynthesis